MSNRKFVATRQCVKATRTLQEMKTYDVYYLVTKVSGRTTFIYQVFNGKRWIRVSKNSFKPLL